MYALARVDLTISVGYAAPVPWSCRTTAPVADSPLSNKEVHIGSSEAAKLSGVSVPLKDSKQHPSSS